MAITKTKFINYVRCPRYVALDDLKKEKLNSNITLSEYKEEEKKAFIEEMLSSMYDEEDNDLIEEVDPQLEAMLPYYNQVELLAGQMASHYFDGTLKYSKDTYNQESFDAVINGIRYICYVDILNEGETSTNIIEVKATTTNTFLKVGATIEKEFVSIFIKDQKGIYRLLEEVVNVEDYMPLKKYNEQKAKLYNKFNSAGHYVYDLAVQRYIASKDLGAKKNMRYYLSVLNSDYVYDGEIVNNERVYKKDIIAFFDMTLITKDMMDIVDNDRKKVETYISNLNGDPVPLGIHCEHKKTTKCKYTKICFSKLPSKNSILNFIDSHHGFKDELGNKFDRFDLIEDGIYSMTDVRNEILNREKNVIQKRVIIEDKPYIDYEKIKAGLSQIKYPIYHLDFETFPCPLPRYKGEKCYSQSVFQFSLHIEKEEGKCDKEKDHFEYLAVNHEDIREELVKKMCEYIDVDSKGTILVYNESFEKTRLKELGELFSDYKDKLNKMRDMMFDLMYVVKTKSSLYEELGFDEERSKLFNYYHKDMSGSFSIKKVLPLFSNLSYDELEVSNGMNALATYASFDKYTKEEYDKKYKALIEYCKQDTWAMVEILKGIKELSNSVNK
jgi:hypothetical protein